MNLPDWVVGRVHSCPRSRVLRQAMMLDVGAPQPPPRITGGARADSWHRGAACSFSLMCAVRSARVIEGAV